MRRIRNIQATAFTASIEAVKYFVCFFSCLFSGKGQADADTLQIRNGLITPPP